MSYALKVSKDKPKGLWMLNGSLADFSGNATAASTAGSAIASYYSALVSNGIKSSSLDSTHRVKFPTRLYRPGYEQDSFSLEAWVFPRSQTATIMSRTGQSDGLAFVNGELQFSLRLSSSTPTIKYPMDALKSMHVVGIYTRQYMSLYVNGELYQRLNFSSDQLFELFAQPSENFLVAGELGSLALQATAIYEYPLSDNQIRMHYKWGREAVDPESVPFVYGGRSIDITDNAADVFLRENIGPEMSWTLGDMGTLVVNNDGELTQQVEETSLAGSWLYSFDTSFGETLYGVRVGWEGEGTFMVSTSIDAVNWTPAVNNRYVSTIDPDGPAPEQLYIKIDFLEGSMGVVSDLEIVGYRSALLNIPNRNSLAPYPLIVREEWNPLEYRNDQGVHCAGSSLTISPSSAEDNNGDFTWEYWYYAENSSAGATIPGADQYFSNGEVFTGLTVGAWTLIHAVGSGESPIEYLSLLGNLIVGRVAVYPVALNQEQCKNIYNMYTGKLRVPITGTSSTIGIGQTSVKTYSSDWAIVGSG